MVERDRCPTGVPGLDNLMRGGFPRRKSVLLSGTCGSGKTTLAMQFLYNGIVEYDEPGILVSLEEDPKELKEDMLAYGLELEALEKAGKLVIIDASLARVGLTGLDESLVPETFDRDSEGSVALLPDEFSIDRILDLVASKAQSIGAKRLVFDSLPALEFLVEEPTEIKIRHVMRQMLLAINYRFKALGLTSLIVTEAEGDDQCIPAGIESYVVDGVVYLHFASLGSESGRSLLIKKMRGTYHSTDMHPLEFVDGEGIRIMSGDLVGGL